MKGRLGLALVGCLLLAIGAFAVPTTSECSACALTWDPVCATVGGQQVEFENACLATCQGITATPGRCTTVPSSSEPGRTLRVPRFSLPKGSMSLSNLTVEASTMNAMSDAGYVYVGTFKSMDGPPAELLYGNGLLMINQTTNQSTAQASIADASAGLAVAWSEGGHMYYQVRQPTKTATITSGPLNFAGFDPTISQPGTSSRASLSRGLGGIIGTDDRRLVNGQANQYPFSTAVKLNYQVNGRSFICSGSLINRRLVLTAGHCIYDRGSRTYASNFFFTTPNGVRLNARVTNMATYQGYVNTGNPEWDIAYLVLDTDLGSTRGWLGTGWDCGSARQTLNTIGYPGDKQNGGTNMYATSCVTRGDSNACQNRPLDHNCDTMGGQSGSPLYVTTSSNPQVRGVLTCSYTSPSIPWNCGAWLRPQVEEVLRDYLRRGS